MPRAGDIYTLPSNTTSPAVAGTPIDPTDFNELTDDIASGLNDSHSVKHPTYGAVGDGTTDDTAAIAAALLANAGSHVYLPPTTSYYKITDALTVPEHTAIYSDGPWSCEIRSTATNKAVLKLVGSASGRGCIVRGLKLSHTGVTAVSGGDGIYAKWLGNYHVIDDVISISNYVGFNLGPVSFATISNCSALQNISDGYNFSDALGADAVNFGPLQWQNHRNFAESNGRDGFRYQIINQGAAVGPIVDPQTFLNSGCGMNFLGLDATHYLSAIRIVGGFLGSDNGEAELKFDTYYTGVAMVSNMYIETAGSAGTGPGVAPAVNTTAFGVYITANNGHCDFANVTVLGSQSHGFYTVGPRTSVANGKFINNGASSGSGLISNNAGSKVHLVNCYSGNTAGGTQAYGYFGADGDDFTLINTTGASNATALTGFTSNAVSGRSLKPIANDTGALGTTSLRWEDIRLASGAVIDFNNDVLLTHSADTLTMTGGVFVVSTAVLDTVAINTNGIINWSSSDLTLTHSSNTLTLAGGKLVTTGGLKAKQADDLFSTATQFERFSNDSVMAVGYNPSVTGFAFSATFVSTGAYLPFAFLTGDTLAMTITTGQKVQIETDRGMRFNNHTSGAAAQTGTLTNAPAAGNPGHWLKINIGGTNYCIPCWAG